MIWLSYGVRSQRARGRERVSKKDIYKKLTINDMVKMIDEDKGEEVANV